MLPGDEIVEKKHKNVKHLMAIANNTDLSRSKTRKFAGLGPNLFKVDFEKQFGYSIQVDEEIPKGRVQSAQGLKEGEVEANEINTEVEIQNTAHHKAIVRQRNEHYLEFQKRFNQSLHAIMSEYDEERKTENRFTQYWNDNLR